MNLNDFLKDEIKERKLINKKNIIRQIKWKWISINWYRI